MNRLSRPLAAALLGVDVALIAGACVLAYVLRFRLGVGLVVDAPPAPDAAYLRALGAALVVSVLVLRSRGLYSVLPLRGVDVLEATLRATTFAGSILLVGSFFYREASFSRAVGVMAWGLLVVALPFPRLALMAWRRRRYAQGRGLTPVWILGTAERAQELTERIARREYFGLEVAGILPPDAGTDALEAALQRCPARLVWIASELQRLDLLELVERCEALKLEAVAVPRLFDLFVGPEDLREVHGVPTVAVCERRPQRLSLAFKRMFDLAVGSALLTMASPVLLWAAWRIRRESPGPVWFAQDRVGEGGRVFRMWKLRSMVPDAEARLRELIDLDRLKAPVFKLDDDPRVFPFGRTLRRWSLDELPQLWNVVRGDMSLVGPRPEEEKVVARYDAHHRRRLKAKPGLTGLQQVEARATTNMDERVRLDVFYLRRRTFLFDLYILARTPWAVVRGEGAR